MTQLQDRAAGALYGLAVGDALGMPTESLPRAQIVARYGALLEDFQPGAADQPLAPGLPAGTVTDDTEQALLLAALIIEGGGAVDEAEFARRLLAWEEDMRARGSLSLLGPSTKRALAALLAGTPITETGRAGTTNGAAMRITPVGVATPAGDPGLLTARVVAASRVTHNTGVALAGAAAVAAAVSAGVDGATVPEAIGAAVAAARLAAGRGRWVAAADVATRITWATGLTAGRPGGRGPGPRGHAGRHEPGHPGVGARRVRAAGRRPGRPVAGLPDGRVGRRGHRHDRGDHRRDRRCLPRRGGLPGAGPGHGHRGERAAAGRGGGGPARRARPVTIQRLLYLGNVVVDIVLDVPALPDRGGDVLARRSRITPGGGFNVMAAAARQGLPVAYAGAHGTGPFADLARAGLAAEGIEVVQPATPGTDTGVVVAVVDDTGERTFVTSPGAEATLTAADLAGVTARPGDAAGLSGYGLVHPSNRGALLGWLARLPAAATVVFDPGPLVMSIPPEALDQVLGRADWLTCNAREAAALTGAAPRPRRCARWRPASPVTAAPLRGCWSAPDRTAACCLLFPQRTRSRCRASRSPNWTPTERATPTRAPSSRRWPPGRMPREAARRANAAAAISVTRRGPATAPTAAELAQFLSRVS